LDNGSTDTFVSSVREGRAHFTSLVPASNREQCWRAQAIFFCAAGQFESSIENTTSPRRPFYVQLDYFRIAGNMTGTR
jgi:hypothetical protein